MNRLIQLYLVRNSKHYCFSIKETLNNANKSKILKQIVPLERYRFKIDSGELPPRTRIDASTIALLERLSLVDCENKQGIETLEAALEFADQILQVDTEGVEPLITVLEDRYLLYCL